MATAKRSPIEKIPALDELDAHGWAWESAGDNEVSIRCPQHTDAHASAQLNIANNLWFCHGCNAKGDIIGLLADIVNSQGEEQVTREAIWTGLDRKYDLSITKTISRVKVEEWHEKVWDCPMRSALTQRGVTEEIIRTIRLGWDGQRITIPVFDREDRVVNVRRYRPGAPGHEKMLNTKGFAKPLRLYLPLQVDYDAVWICGGEMKAAVAAHYLNPLGIGAVAVTAGEGSWSHALSQQFHDKCVYICFDIDNKGRTGGRKVAHQLCFEASIIKMITLPLSPAEYPKGDINDWVHALGRIPKAEDFTRLMESAAVFVPDDLEQEPDDDQEVEEVKLSQALTSDCIGKKVAVDAVIQAMDETPYLIPSKVGVKCTKDQPNCFWCPVKPMEANERTGRVEITIKGTSPGLLRLIGTTEKDRRKGLMEACRIPTCKSAEFAVYDHFDISDVRLTTQINLRGENKDHVLAPAYVIHTDLELNTPYTLTGRVFPHPKNQQAVLLMDTLEEAPDSLSAFDPSDAELEELEVFQPTGTIDEKVSQIYDDLTANVTRIFYRNDLHLVFDLTFHSVLNFNFAGRIRTGWINSAIVGDSSQGKTETANRLMDHYGLGERVDCKNASAAGLIGGLQQLGNRWFVSWGIIPIHDRRLVVCEEVKGISVEELARMTDMRSSGKAIIGKIEKREAHARTRLVFISNPRTNREVATYNFGISTIKELFGGPEDVRRCDVGLVLSEREIDHSAISALIRSNPVVEHIHKSVLCRRLVLWAWTRQPEQVQFSKQAETECLDVAERLCEKFRAPATPLVDSGTAQFKVAKLSAALAARLFSTDSTRKVLRVKKEHATWIGEWLDRIYSSSVMGYHDFSNAQMFADTVIDPQVVRRKLEACNHAADLVQNLLHQEEIELVDLQDWCDFDRDDAQTLLSFLVRKHAIFRRKRSYYKTSQFITLLKAIADSGVVARPEDGEDF